MFYKGEIIMTTKEIIECFIVSLLIVGNMVGVVLLLKMVFGDIIRIIKGEAY